MRNGTETNLWPAGPPCRPLYPVQRDRIPDRRDREQLRCRDGPRCAAVPLHRGAGGPHRKHLAGELGEARDVQRAQPGRLAGSGGRHSPVPDDKLFVQDMFPYPSGEGLHVGHPLGYIATDVYARYFRMTGHNVLHALGFDAFGLPAEQYAVQTGTHPRTRTEANVVNFRRQLGRLGLGHDSRRSFSTTDVEFYKWTQWIFLQIYNAWFDTAANKARPIAELIAEFDSGARQSRGRAGLGRRCRRGSGPT